MSDSEFGKIDWAAYYAREGDVYAGREDADTLHRCRAVWNVFPRSGVRSYVDVGCGEGFADNQNVGSGEVREHIAVLNGEGCGHRDSTVMTQGRTQMIGAAVVGAKGGAEARRYHRWCRARKALETVEGRAQK